MQRLYVIVIALLLPLSAQAQSHELGSVSTDNQGPSTEASQMLQPTSPTALQSLQGADSVEGGIPQTSSNSSLQAAGNQGDFNAFVGPIEAMGTKQESIASDNNVPWAFWLLAIFGIAAIALFLPAENTTTKEAS
jgi:hypothetical protein